MIILFIITIILTPFIYKIFIGENFSNSIIYVFWIALGFLFQGFYFMVTNYIFYEKKTQFLSIITFCNSIFNIVITYYFINIFGTIGAAYSFTLSCIIIFISAWLLSHRIYPMPWFKRT